MAGFNGSGSFVRTYNWVTDKSNSVKVTASRMDAEDDGFATGLSNTITKDGQQTTTAAIPFAGGAVKLSDGSAGTPAVNFINDTDCGFYRIGANNIALSMAGSKVWDYGTATASAAGSLVIGGTLAATGAVDFTATASAAMLIVTGEVRGASANFTATCSAAGFHATGLVTGASANFTATCAAATLVASGAVNGASANFTSTCSAAVVVSTGAVIAGNGLTVTTGSVSLPAGSVASAALAQPTPLVFLAKATASNSASLAFTTGIDSTYKAYRFDFHNCVPATNNVAFSMQVSTDAGSSYKTTAYTTVFFGAGSDGTTGATGGTGSFALHLTISNSAGAGVSGSLTLTDPSGTGNTKYVHGVSSALQNGASTTSVGLIGGAWTSANTAINAVKFLMSSGNISTGEVVMYGIKDA